MADDDKADEGTVTFANLRDVIKEVVSDLIGKDKGPDKEPEKAKEPEYEAENSKTARETLAAQVRAELEKVRKSDAEESDKLSAAQRLQALEEKLAEKGPIERRRVHKIMGWGD
jgi:hypothetical protein